MLSAGIGGSRVGVGMVGEGGPANRIPYDKAMTITEARAMTIRNFLLIVSLLVNHTVLI